MSLFRKAIVSGCHILLGLLISVTALPVHALADTNRLTSEDFSLLSSSLANPLGVTVDGVESMIVFEPSTRGLHWSLGTNPGVGGNLEEIAFDGTSYSVLAADEDGVVVVVSTPDGLGGMQDVTVSGALDPGGDWFSGQVMSGAGGGAIQIGFPVDGLPGGGAVTPDLVLIIIISAAAIVAAGCAINAVTTNCIKDCSAACEESGGMQSAKEGLCGTCECTCKKSQGE